MTLTHLGQGSTLPASPQEAVLDYVSNPRRSRPYLVRFTAPESSRSRGVVRRLPKVPRFSVPQMFSKA